MALTEKAQKVLNFLEENGLFEEFTSSSLSEKMGEKIAPATLTSLAKNGYLERFDTTPKTYKFLVEKRNEISIKMGSSEKTNGDIVSKLFNLANTIESEIQAITHWMQSDSYATEPGTQVGIYKIVDKTNNRVIYVGKTERPFSQRWEEHKKLLEAGIHHSPELQNFFNSIKKDFSKISFEILQELPKDPKIIDLRERFWIQKYEDTILNYMRPKLVK